MSAFRSILVGIGAATPADPALDQGVALARRDGARLTLLFAAGALPSTVWLAPGLPGDPHAELLAACEARRRAVVAALPPELPVTTVIRRGALRQALLGEVRSGAHDLVIVGRRSATSRLLRRAQVPLLVAG